MSPAARRRSRPTLYLVRHGQTEWNAAGRFQGTLDSPLTPRGEAQADAIGRVLRQSLDGPLLAHVSPRERTRTTAAIIARHAPLHVSLEPRIAEIHLGAWEGMTAFEIDQEYPGALAGADRTGWLFRAPGGERYDEIYARVSDWLTGLMEEALVVVSHGLAGKIIRGVYLGLSERDTLGLDSPQDGYFRVEPEGATFVRCTD